MSREQDEPVEKIEAAEVTLQSDEAEPTSIIGDVIKSDEGDVVVKFSASQFADRPELLKALSQGELPVTVWAQLVDTTTGQLVQKGQTLLAWVRVKGSDGTFMTKTALFGLGVVAAISLTRRATHHYKSR
jgi:hypothetical protein